MYERTARAGVCLWCGEKFVCAEVGLNEQLLYCGHTHQIKYQRVRRENAGKVCPRPDKRKYPTRSTASKKLVELQAKGAAEEQTQVYKCYPRDSNHKGCGWWHLGTRDDAPAPDMPVDKIAAQLKRKFRVTRSGDA